MILYVLKWNIHPDKTDVYVEWAQSSIARALAVGDVVELRGYRAASGASQIVTTFEFADMGAWAAWHQHDAIQQMLIELRTMANNVTADIWGPSPLTPQPVRPGG